MCSAKAAGFIHTADVTQSGGRSLLQLVPAILFGTSRRTTVTRARPHGCGDSGGFAGAFCAPIATPHAEPPLNGVMGFLESPRGYPSEPPCPGAMAIGAQVAAPTQEGKAIRPASTPGVRPERLTLFAGCVSRVTPVTIIIGPDRSSPPRLARPCRPSDRPLPGSRPPYPPLRPSMPLATLLRALWSSPASAISIRSDHGMACLFAVLWD